jgi:RNA polymerase sigma factor (sigma-70 family)
VTITPATEDLLRALTPQVLGALGRRYGHFDACEDATQEALLAATRQWPERGLPEDPRAWLITVASRRLIDQLRSDRARHLREDADATLIPPGDVLASPGADRAFESAQEHDRDDTLTLLFLCCHPSLSPPSQIALTLRSIGGLSTGEIARAFLVPEATMAQRISRAKQAIREAGLTFSLPPEAERPARLAVVAHVLYLIFSEGYTASAGPSLHRRDLSDEAIRITRLLRAALGDAGDPDGEVTGLLALMLLTDARRTARARPDGTIVLLADQDRSLWDRAAIDEGVTLVSGALARGALGPYQLQAAIAAIHDEAPSDAGTDWPQVLALYDLLERTAPGPMVTLNRAVAVAMVRGPRAGLDLLDALEGDGRMSRHHRLHAVRAHLQEMAGDVPAARGSYRLAAAYAVNLPERRYLEAQVLRLRDAREGEPVDPRGEDPA